MSNPLPYKRPFYQLALTKSEIQVRCRVMGMTTRLIQR